MPTKAVRALLVSGVTLAAVAVAATPALASADATKQAARIQKLLDKAGGPVAATGDCGAESLSQPFLRWADASWYTLAPQGAAESTGDWSLAGGAAVVADNDPYLPGSHAVSLGGGGDAVTPVFCLDVNHPTVRFFVRNTGPALSKLNVSVLYQDTTGKTHELQVATIQSGSAWAPTSIVPLFVNVLAQASPTGTTAAALHLSTSGPKTAGAGWTVDDILVDPYKYR